MLLGIKKIKVLVITIILIKRQDNAKILGRNKRYLLHHLA
jgi:hypothetical protein